MPLSSEKAVEERSSRPLQGRAFDSLGFRVHDLAVMSNSHTPFSPALVGRARELAVVSERLQAAVNAERTGVVFIAGEPGVGKSRLVQEAGAVAKTQGWLVLTGHAYDTESMPPYLPFIEALTDHVRVCEIDDLKLQLGNDQKTYNTGQTFQEPAATFMTVVNAGTDRKSVV